MSCCSDCPMTNAPYLESSEQLDSFFLDFFHKIKSHIFQNISKCTIHILRHFKYKNTCELCDNIQDKEMTGRIMVKKCFVFCKEVVDVFHDKCYIPTIEKMSFHLANFRIIGSMEYKRTRNDCFHDNE